MRIALSEIWSFTSLLNQREESMLVFTLVAGEAKISDIPKRTIDALQTDEGYDTELLPSLFTFREILWQPNVYPDAHLCLPSVRILSAYCLETAENYRATKGDVHLIYAQLLEAIAAACQAGIDTLEKEQGGSSRALGLLRQSILPIIKFFIAHPQNRLAYYQDAINRLNYAVKIMITQLHGKYTDLLDPYWEVTGNERLRTTTQ